MPADVGPAAAADSVFGRWSARLASEGEGLVLSRTATPAVGDF